MKLLCASSETVEIDESMNPVCLVEPLHIMSWLDYLFMKSMLHRKIHKDAPMFFYWNHSTTCLWAWYINDPHKWKGMKSSPSRPSESTLRFVDFSSSSLRRNQHVLASEQPWKHKQSKQNLFTGVVLCSFPSSESCPYLSLRSHVDIWRIPANRLWVIDGARVCLPSWIRFSWHLRHGAHCSPS